MKSTGSRLRNRITITDNEGDLFAEVWAEIEPATNGQKLITIRYVNGLVASMCIKFGNKEFVIMDIKNPYEENILLEILVIEQTQ